MMWNMGYRRGVNLGGWLSQCDYSEERLQHFIKEEDIRRIAAWGMDHIRIPVDYNVLEDENGQPIERGCERLEWAMNVAADCGLKVVLDLHKTAGFSFDSGEKETGFFSDEGYQERFCRLWERLAQRFGDRPTQVAFELLNEVTEPSFIDAWNRISTACIRRIRAFAPDTLILVGSYWNNHAKAVKDLALPVDDKVIYNFHCYEPLAYTHQGAGWVKDLDRNARIAFEDSGATEAYFEGLFAPAIEAAKKAGTSLYCGEYGVIDVVPTADAIKWFGAINAVLERHHIPRAVWSYKRMSFGVSDAYWDDLRDELLRVL